MPSPTTQSNNEQSNNAQSNNTQSNNAQSNNTQSNNTQSNNAQSNNTQSKTSDSFPNLSDSHVATLSHDEALTIDCLFYILCDVRIELFTTDGPGVSRCTLQQRESFVSCCTFTADRECCFTLDLYSRQRVLFHAVPL